MNMLFKKCNGFYRISILSLERFQETTLGWFSLPGWQKRLSALGLLSLLHSG
jgi:hypothetical protein